MPAGLRRQSSDPIIDGESVRLGRRTSASSVRSSVRGELRRRSTLNSARQLVLEDAHIGRIDEVASPTASTQFVSHTA
jgi:hypothetical protein